MADLYCHPTQGPYTTYAAAYAAANPGDRILLTPGTWTAPGALTKAVHLVGVTNNPVTQPVIVAGTYTWDGNLNKGIYYKLSSDPGFPIVVENINPRHQYGGDADVVLESSVPGVLLVLNRCILNRHGLPSGWSVFGVRSANNCTIRMQNCTIGADYNAVIYYPNQTQKWETVKTLATGGLSTYQGTLPLTMVVSDHVTAATDGYGAIYGSEISGGAPWLRVLGQVILPDGVDRSTATVYLLQEYPTGKVRLDYYSSATPNAATGAWEFKWVPPGIRFWVMVLPPAGYEPRIEGPLTGVAV